jgi:hypothetical protein
MSAMKDPKIQQIVSQSPMVQAIMAAMSAHINEHIGYEYRKQMEQRMGTMLPSPEKIEEDGIPEHMEVQISQLAARAGQQLMQQNQQEATAQKNQQTAQDPLIQLQQQELQIKQQDLQRRATKDKIDAAAKADQLEIERQRIAAQERIAGMQVGAKTAKDKAELAAKQQLEGVRIGTDIAYKKEQFTRQTTQPKGK